MIRNGLLKEVEEQMLNVLSLDEMSLCLLLELSQDGERMFSLVSPSLALLLARRKRKERARMVSAAFYFTREGVPEQNSMSFSLDEIYNFELQRPKQFQHQIII